MTEIRDPSNPHRLSFDPDRISALADDIAANGLLQPPGIILDATGEGGEIAFGHRRMMAVRMLGWDVVTVRTFPPGTDPLQARLSENEQREELTPVEQSQIVGECIARGESPAQVARRFRRGLAWVHERAAILDWPPEVKAAVHEKRISLAVAHELAAIDHEAYRRELIAEAERTGASRATAAMWRAHFEAHRPTIVTNQATLDQLRAGRDEYIIRHQCPFCNRESAIEKTKLYRVCLDCARVMESQLDGSAGGADPT